MPAKKNPYKNIAAAPVFEPHREEEFTTTNIVNTSQLPQHSEKKIRELKSKFYLIVADLTQNSKNSNSQRSKTSRSRSRKSRRKRSLRRSSRVPTRFRKVSSCRPTSSGCSRRQRLSTALAKTPSTCSTRCSLTAMIKF